MANTASRFLVTIDREEWQSVRRHEIHKKEWWAFKLKRLDWLHGVGRTVFQVDLDKNSAEPLFSVPQQLDKALLDDVQGRLAVWAKALSRGMRTIWYDGDGNIVLADIFGVYRLSPKGELLKYLTITDFGDIHCVQPGRDKDHLLVTCTGTEEILEVRWDGTIVERIVMKEVFGTGVNTALQKGLDTYKDRRLLPLDHTKHVFHVNWARFLSDGKTILISCHTPGLVATLRKDGGAWKVVWQHGYFPHCHCPDLDEASGVFYVCVSRADEARAVDSNTGHVLWRADRILYGKATVITGPDRVVAGDCNGKRIVELDRATGKVTREVKLPGIPYGIGIAP